MPDNHAHCTHGPDHHHAAHDEHSGCAHGPAGMHVHGATEGPMLWVSLAVTMVFVTVEAVAGYRASSLALVSDAGHNFTDAFALGLAAYALWVARKPATLRKTFGYHRAAILSALLNATSLILIALLILVEAWKLFRDPAPVQGNIVMWIAGASVLMNTVIALLLNGGAKKNLNIRAAYLHQVGDALSAVGVLIAGIVVRYTGWVYADPLVSVLIAAFILWSSWGIVKEATNILLEGTPKGLDVAAMVAAMRGVEHVQEVHDVHVWTVSDGLNFLSCHVAVDGARSLDDCSAIIGELNALLSREFGIGHATIQIEGAGRCGDGGASSPLCLDGAFTPPASSPPARREALTASAATRR